METIFQPIPCISPSGLILAVNITVATSVGWEFLADIFPRLADAYYFNPITSVINIPEEL